MTIRPIRPATRDDLDALQAALDHLRHARNALRAAGCPQALAKVRHALKSAEGAERHMHHRLRRTLPPLHCGRCGIIYPAGARHTCRTLQGEARHA